MSFLLFLKERSAIGCDVFEIARGSEYIGRENLDEFLISAANLSEEGVASLKAEYYGVDYIPDNDLAKFNRLAKINHALGEIYIPYDVHENDVTVAVSDLDDLILTDKIKKFIITNHRIDNPRIKFCITKARSLRNMAVRKSSIRDSSIDNRFISDLLAESVEVGASDIHISPYESTCEIKRRIDGELQHIRTLPIVDYHSICVSTKVMAKLDISETRRPQSGHLQKDNVDFRISTQPTIYGENLSIRILNKNKQYINIENIGFSDEQVKYLRQISNFPHGMIIFCGPTGSGKTTSIYSMISLIDKQKKNIMTLEDPIEYRINGVKQTDISEGIIDFATGISSILRQDPDVIFIGEIRDSETAHMAIRASMTGHLVFTTMHANDSIGAIKRFQDFGISSFLVADNIISIISQRIVRKIMGGMTIISEILHVDELINNLIHQNASRSEIMDKITMRTAKFKTIRDDAMGKVAAGLISKEEIDRVLCNVKLY
jgi:type II secretory ATPase GspE/PulE/Tfp pilus assembly ATPase PilB-like protein